MQRKTRTLARRILRSALVGAVALAPLGCPAPSKVICPDCKVHSASWEVPNYPEFGSSTVASARMTAVAKYTGTCPLDPAPTPCEQTGAKNVTVTAPGPGSADLPMETSPGAIHTVTISVSFVDGTTHDIAASVP